MLRISRTSDFRDGRVDRLLERIVEAKSPNVIQAFEERIDALEKKRLLLEEEKAECRQTPRGFGEMYRIATQLLSNPLKIWKSKRSEDKRAVLKLVFSDRLICTRNEGYRTPKLSSFSRH